MEQKRVNIYPRGAITTLIPPIRMPIHKVTKKIKDIRLALLAGARVEEILPDGRTISLNINNYDKDNMVNVNPKKVEKVVVEAAPAELPKQTISEVKEEPSSDEKVEKIEPKSVQSEVVESKPEVTEVKQETVEEPKPEYMTRKQRRAFEAEQRRKEQEAAANKVEEDKKEETVEVKNPEEGNV